MKRIGTSLLLLTLTATGSIALAQGTGEGVLRKTGFFSDAYYTNQPES